MNKNRHTLIPSSYLVLIRDLKIEENTASSRGIDIPPSKENKKEVLMARRFQTGYCDGQYSLPAGHVEKGESFSRCLAREVKEEINIDLVADGCKVVHVMHHDSKTQVNNERIHIFWTASHWSGEIQNLEPNKCDDLSWFPLEDLPENTIPYIRHALECIQKGIVYSEYGYDV